jgi:hypothetical protein
MIRIRAVVLFLGVCLAAVCVRGGPTIDDSDYAGLLRDHVRGGLVDYPALRADARLDAYLATLARIDLREAAPATRLAYWINTYNAVTLKLMTESWPVVSILKLHDGKPWDRPLFTPHGADVALSLNQIEHEIVRREFAEPRIHFALVCAAVSCPPLRSEPYVAERLEEQLEDQTRSFLRDRRRNLYDRDAHRLHLSALFDWYAVDFGGAAAVPAYVRTYLDSRDMRIWEAQGVAPAVEFMTYDWAPNSIAAPSAGK